jgi:hypothetical protein
MDRFLENLLYYFLLAIGFTVGVPIIVIIVLSILAFLWEVTR